MKNSKLILILESISSKEIRQLTGYIEAQKNTNTLVYRLYSLLLKQYPEFNIKFIEKEKIYKKLFPDSPYKEKRLSKLMSELTDCIEEYIVIANKSKNLIEEHLVLLRYYYEKNLDKCFNSTSKELKSILDTLPESSSKSIAKYKFAELMASYELKENSRNSNYQNVYNVLIEMSEAEKLRWKNLSILNQFSSIDPHIPRGICYTIHKQLNDLLNEEHELALDTILNEVEDNIAKFDKEESREILKIILDYAMKKVNNGDLNFYEHIVRVYKLFILKDLILNDNGLITIPAYKNYIRALLKFNNINEALDFLESYKDKLPLESRAQIYSFNKATIWFEQEKYSDIIEILKAVNFDDIYYKLNLKRLLIKTYYKLYIGDDASYFTIMDAQINSFYKFIHLEKTVPEVHILANKHFVKFIRKVISIGNFNLAEKKRLLQKIKSTKQLAERDWLEKLVA